VSSLGTTPLRQSSIHKGLLFGDGRAGAIGKWTSFFTVCLYVQLGLLVAYLEEAEKLH
jgi:hypothetical protein